MRIIRNVIFTLALIPSLSLASIEIKSSDAAFHIGKNVIACGTVKQATRFKRGVYLNMYKPYPHQSLTLVVWDNDIHTFQNQHGALSDMTEKNVCAQGVITQYNGKNQMSLENSYSIKMM